MCGGSETKPGFSYRPARGIGGTPPLPGTVPTTGAVYEGVAGLHAYREMSAETCAVSVRDDLRSFSAKCRLYHLGPAVLVDVCSSSLRYVRSARHIARGAYDHYQIICNLSGQIHYRSGRQSVIAHAGDIIILDSARETGAYVRAPAAGSAHTLTLFVPRAALPPLLRAPGGGHLLLLSGARPPVWTLHDRLSQVLERVEFEGQAQVHAAALGLIRLLSGSLSRRTQLAPTVRQAMRRSTADSLERLIERRLDSPALSLELLCAHAGCSRATVYRLLEADGGPIRYIRQRRLQRALQELISGSVSRGSILELALRHRFASEATFNRAFRRTFGIPPGQVREIAARSRRTAGGGGNDAAEGIGWIRALGTGPGGPLCPASLRDSLGWQRWARAASW